MRHYFLLSLVLIWFSCSDTDSGAPAGDTNGSGVGGSLARFTIVGDFLYTLEPNRLSWFNIENGNLEYAGEDELFMVMETIFPLGNKLFLGADSGMSIYLIGDDGEPSFQSSVNHIRACDPVVANDQYAYVTLRQTDCGGFFVGNNGLEDVLNIYDVTNIENPSIIRSYELSQPRGLGLAGDYLFICEGPEGLRTLDVSDPRDVQFLAFKQDIHANDVIVLPDALLVIGPDNITQLDYTDPVNLVEISSITIP
ncbi:MAG: hypothetical protein AAF741_11790 [Bacteroidota bacterium]